MEKRELTDSQIENVSAGASEEQAQERKKAVSQMINELNKRPSISYAGPDQTYVLPKDLEDKID